MELILLFLISIPVFYVWGIISFIRMLTRTSVKKTDIVIPQGSRKEYLRSVIADLKQKITTHPEIQITDIIKEYESESEKLYIANPPVPTQSYETSKDISTTPDQQDQMMKSLVRNDSKDTPSTPNLQNWYKDNSINLLLYIGAFLIIVSATIFVSRENVSGISKGIIITLLTNAFYFSGLTFSKMPRIKNAGITFTAIGALLIPICGLGWYNFVFKSMGFNPGIIWMITSFIALGAYTFLAKYYKSIFYSFITSFSSLSLSFSLVKMQNQQNEYYILASIITCLILLWVSIYLKERNAEDDKILGEPMSLTANYVLPISIFFTLIQSSAVTYSTLHVVTSLFLGGIFYVIKYLQTQTAWHVPAIQLLFSLTLIYFGWWIELSSLHILFLLTGMVYIFIYCSALFNKRNKKTESDASSFMSVTLTILIFLVTYMTDITAVSRLFFAFSGITVGILLTLITREIYILALSIAFTGILSKVFLSDIQGYELHILGSVYSALAILLYLLTDLYKHNNKSKQLFASACLIFFLISTLLIGKHWSYQIANMFLMSLLSYLSIFKFNKDTFAYGGNLLLGAVLFSTLQQTEASIVYYPLWYVTLSICFYLTGLIINKPIGTLFRNSGIIGALITTIVYFVQVYTYGYFDIYNYFDNFVVKQTLHKNTLITAYITTALFGYEAYRSRSSALGYLASAIGLCTYLWQLDYVGVTNTLPYTYVMGIYFMVIAFLQRSSRNQNLKEILDYLGLFFLIVPTWVLTFNAEDLSYAFALGITGVGLLFLSITFNDRLYRYASISAIVLAVTSQSRWAIIGIAGIGFLVFALYLLIFRKEDKNHPE